MGMQKKPLYKGGRDISGAEEHLEKRITCTRRTFKEGKSPQVVGSDLGFIIVLAACLLHIEYS